MFVETAVEDIEEDENGDHEEAGVWAPVAGEVKEGESGFDRMCDHSGDGEHDWSPCDGNF